MRIVLFIVGAIAVIYLMVKGFKQVLEEARAKSDDEASAQYKQIDTDHQRRSSTHRNQHDDDHDAD